MEALVKETLLKLQNLSAYIDDDEVTETCFEVAELIKQLFKMEEI